MIQTKILLEKIHSYDSDIQTAMKALKHGMTKHQVEPKDGVLLVPICELIIAQNPELWRGVLRPLIMAVMTPLNAQAKFVQGLCMIMKYHRSNLGDDNALMFAYTDVIQPQDAALLYMLEFLNFTAGMGKSVLDWAGGGEGLFFSLYFDDSYDMFHVGMAIRPLSQPGFLREGVWNDSIVEKLKSRQEDREARWNEIYPPLAPHRPDLDAEIASFLSAVTIVANKDANYKGPCQEGWTDITAWAKAAFPAVKDVDAIPAADLLALFQRDDSMGGRLYVLDRFFGTQFVFARSCTALRLDLMSDKRLPSIARILCIHAFANRTHGGTSVVPVSEWWLMLVYGTSRAAASPCLQDIRALLVSRDPLLIEEHSNEQLNRLMHLN